MSIYFSTPVTKSMSDFIYSISLIRRVVIQMTGVHEARYGTNSFDRTRLPQLDFLLKLTLTQKISKQNYVFIPILLLQKPLTLIRAFFTPTFMFLAGVTHELSPENKRAKS